MNKERARGRLNASAEVIRNNKGEVAALLVLASIANFLPYPSLLAPLFIGQLLAVDLAIQYRDRIAPRK